MSGTIKHTDSVNIIQFNRLSEKEIELGDDQARAEEDDPIPPSFYDMDQSKDRHKERYFRMQVLTGVFAALFVIMVIAFGTARDYTLGALGDDDVCYDSADTYAQYEVRAWNGTVATDVFECSQIGADVLYEGGNAADAAVASAFCLGVLSPASSGIGGGCMIVHYSAANDSAVFIDSREKAPSGATPNMFAEDPLKAQQGGLAVGVIAEMKGLHLLYEKFGSGVVPWSRLVLPASELAQRWVISQHVADSIASVKPMLLSGEYPELAALYLKPGPPDANGSTTMTVKVAGDIVEQPVLSQTLHHVATEGIDYVYQTMASSIAAEIQGAGGLVTAADLQNYEAKLYTQPITGTFMGLRYYGAAGSSSGGATVLGILNYLDALKVPLAALGEQAYAHLLLEAFNHAFAVRAHLGDPDFVNTTANVVNSLLNLPQNNSLPALCPPDVAAEADADNGSGFGYMAHLLRDYTLLREVLPSVFDYGGECYNLSSVPGAADWNSSITDHHGDGRRRGRKLAVEYRRDAAEAARGAAERGEMGTASDRRRQLLPWMLPEDHGTTHLSAVDNEGNAVALTSTVNTYFGSKVVSASTGMVFNNQMDDFSIPPASGSTAGTANYFGLVPSPLNYPEPGKRPLSSMSPSIIVTDDAANVDTAQPGNAIHEQQQANGGGSAAPRKKVRLVGGASGGPRIITAVAEVILRHLALGNDLLSSVTAPKMHSQLMPPYEASVEARSTYISGRNDAFQQNIVDATNFDPHVGANATSGVPSTLRNREFPPATTPVEVSFSDTAVAALKQMGHRISTTTSVGITQFIAVDPDTQELHAVSDFRKGGFPVGVNLD